METQNSENKINTIENKLDETEIKVEGELSLNVLCAICSEFFKNTDIIYSTSECGHVFHRQCLFRWLARSQTCPQCRANVFKHNVHRLFLNFSEPFEIEEEDVQQIKNFDWLCVDDDITAEELAKSCFALGLDEQGDPIYAARVYFGDDLLPGYYVPKNNTAFVAWGCESHEVFDGIELLHIYNDAAEYKWIASSDGEIPDNALASGYCETDEKLYTARTMYEDKMRYGKLHPSHGCAYFPYEGRELNNSSYEVLVTVPKTKG